MGEFISTVFHTGFQKANVIQKYKDDASCLSPEKAQLQQYAEAFYGLARLFQKMPCQKQRLGDQDLEEVYGQVHRSVCSICPRETSCWGNDYFRSCRVLYEGLTELSAHGQVSSPLLRQMDEWCICTDEVVHALEEAYGQARISLMWNNRMMEQRMAAGEQIFQTAELLRTMAESFSRNPQLDDTLRRKLRKEFGHMGIILDDIRIFSSEKDRGEIYLSLRAVRKICVSAKTVAEVLSECCKIRMRPAWNCRAAVCEQPASFHFVPDTRFQIFCGISKITRAGELISGDNYAFLQKDTGKVVMSLADGMGSGAVACRESEKVIELLEQFLSAGFPQETAVRMINSCMLLQNSQQMFSTIDLCMVDLYNGQCDLIKSGAASTFIIHENEIEVLGTGAFPTGILQQSDYESIHRQLKSGTSIIMMTDGVLEALPEENREQKMAELIGKTATKNAKEFARNLMEKVYLMQKLRAKDDMTILVGTIWAKE